MTRDWGGLVAIKVIRAEAAERSDFRIRFQREAQATAALNHPHICTLYDVGEQEGAPYLVMEYVEGQTLASRLREGPSAARPTAAPRGRKYHRRWRRHTNAGLSIVI